MISPWMSQKTIFLRIEGAQKFVSDKDDGNDSPQLKGKEEVAKAEYFRTINTGNVREICVGF